MHKKIDNILFDLGGVLYDIDYPATFIRLSEILGINVEVGNWPEPFKETVFAYETGKINTESFINRLQRLSKLGVPDAKDLIDAWNAMLIGWKPGVFDLLSIIGKEYNLYLLSNISPLHAEELEKGLMDKGGVAYLYNYFREYYFSFEIGYRKPSINAFKHVMRKNKLSADTILFIDDYQSNILEAKSIGIQCVVVDPKENLKKTLKNYVKFVC